MGAISAAAAAAIPSLAGLTLYVRSMRGLSGAELAREAATWRATGARSVALMAESLSGPMGVDGLVEQARAARDHGLRVHLWTFPDHTRRSADDVGAHLLRAIERVAPSTVTLDIERCGPRKRPPSAVWVDTLAALAAASVPTLVSSYGVRRYHPTMPWASMASPRIAGGQPQLYETAMGLAETRRALASWRELYGNRPLYPAIPVYPVSALERVAQLRIAWRHVVLDGGTTPAVPGAYVWSESQIDADERRVLRELVTAAGW